MRWFTADEPGSPLGSGMPLGRSLRADGESHRQAWMRILRADPCAFCGTALIDEPVDRRTVDHIEPQNPLNKRRSLGGRHCWLNLTAACASCNGNKGSRSLLDFLRTRSYKKPSAATSIIAPDQGDELVAA